MIATIFSLLVVFGLVVFGEYLWRTHKLKGEIGRKFIHITVGSFVAFWPIYMSFRSVQLISMAFLLVVLASKYFNVFKAIHTIDRKTWGDVMFAVGIGLTALLTKSTWVFAAAILHLSLADGLAAVIGKRYGRTNGYKVFGYTKSIAGTTTFWLVSVIILVTVFTFGAAGQWATVPLIIWLPIVAGAIENMGIYGLDNIFVPLLIVIALSQLQFAL